MRILAAVLLASTVVASAAEFVGTDLVAGPFGPGIAASSAGRCSADFAGSLPGRQALAAGRASAAILLRTDGEPEPVAPEGVKLIGFPLANAAAVLVVHKSNRVEQVSFAQLAGLFAKNPRTSIITWNDLPGGASELVTPTVCSPSGSFVRELFLGFVLEGGGFRDDVRQDIAPELAAELCAVRTSGLQLMPYAPAGVGKALQVSDGRPGRPASAYSPDEQNIYNGDYPLRLPLWLYFRADRQAELRPALRWVLSEEAAELLRRQGLHPAPRPARDQFVQRLDTR